MNGGVVFILAVLVGCIFDFCHAESLEDRIKTLETTVSKQSAVMKELEELILDQRKTNSGQPQELYTIKQLLQERDNEIIELGDRIGHLQSTLEEQQDQIKLLQQSNPAIQSDRTITSTRDGTGEDLHSQTEAVNIKYTDEESPLKMSLKTTVQEKPLKYSHVIQQQIQRTKKLSDEKELSHPETGYFQNFEHALHDRQLDGSVAFHAVVTPNEITNLGAGQTIKFNHVQLNLGNGYHNDIGIFIAPKAGLYLFSATLGSTELYYYYAYIVKSGHKLASITGTSSGTHNQGSVTIPIELNVGESVWVVFANPANGKIYGNYYSSFSGVLIAPM